MGAETTSEGQNKKKVLAALEGIENPPHWVLLVEHQQCLKT